MSGFLVKFPTFDKIDKEIFWSIKEMRDVKVNEIAKKIIKAKESNKKRK